MSRYFQPGEQRSSKVHELFCRISCRYDLMNDLMSLGLHRLWKRSLVKNLTLRPGQIILDLCCGTGDICFEFSRKTGLSSTIIGLDFTQPMLERARKRQQEDVQNPVTFICGDALNLPFQDASFDVITISFGLRNLSDIQHSLDEMQRVLKPGGTLAILDFGKPRNPVIMRIYFAYLSVVIPLMGLLFVGDAQAYAYILKSLKVYPAQHGVAEMLKKMGMEKVRILNLAGGTMGINYASKPLPVPERV